MSASSKSLAITAAVALAGPSLAQTQAVPAFADAAEGHHAVAMPFGVPGFRTQILVDAAAIAANGAVLNGLRFRADRSSLPATATAVPNVTISLSLTTATIGALDATFANNVTGVETVVFQGTVSLPGHTDGAAGALPWDIDVPFAQPFGFSTGQGNLLIDIVANNPAGGAPNYYLDAVQAGGSATQFGTGGDNPSFDFLNLIASTGNSLEPRLLAPGRTVEFTSALSFTTPPGVLALGVTAPASPVDLAPIGAPGNSLYMVPEVLVAHAWTQSFIGWYSTVSLQVPNLPVFIGAMLFAQSAVIEPTANPLGLVLSHAIEVRIGDANATLPLQQVDADDPNATSGNVLDFGFSLQEFGATPIQLGGVFF